LLSFTKKKKKKSNVTAGQLLNLESEVAFLRTEVSHLGFENVQLKKEKANTDVLIKELGLKLHELVVQNEQLKCAATTTGK
jgi:hypothetical protein